MCQKLPEPRSVGRGYITAMKAPTWLWLNCNFFTLAQFPWYFFIRHFIAVIQPVWRGVGLLSQSVFGRLYLKDIHGCVKTFRVLMRPSEICIDNQQRKEAIELRQAPKSVKPCYPKGKNQCSPFWVGMLLYTALTHCSSLTSSGARMTFKESS